MLGSLLRAPFYSHYLIVYSQSLPTPLRMESKQWGRKGKINIPGHTYTHIIYMCTDYENLHIHMHLYTASGILVRTTYSFCHRRSVFYFTWKLEYVFKCLTKSVYNLKNMNPETPIQNNLCTPMFIAAQFTIAKC